MTVAVRDASHVAPQHERVPAAIDDLIAFIARDDLPVIAQAAIAHAQFEIIHPFVDGNGRTGRALVHAIMRSKGVVIDTIAPISWTTLLSRWTAPEGGWRVCAAMPLGGVCCRTWWLPR